jgi:hypothetical protein
LPIPESVDELSYVVRSAAYPILLKMSIKVDGIDTKTILKSQKYNCHEKCIVGTYNIRSSFFPEGETKDDNTGDSATVGRSCTLLVFVDNLDAWMYALQLFFEFRDKKTGKLIR